MPSGPRLSLGLTERIAFFMVSGEETVKDKWELVRVSKSGRMPLSFVYTLAKYSEKSSDLRLRSVIFSPFNEMEGSVSGVWVRCLT